MIYVMSGGTKLFAAIGVTYPSGSTLTCTNGTKTLTAKTTSGQWVFAIPEEGTWTVTATQGTNTKSQSVSITKEGQFEKVELSYELVLFEAGTEYNTDITGGFTFDDASRVTVGSSITLTGNKTYFGTGHKYWDGSSAYYTKQKVTPSAYSSFCVRVTKNTNESLIKNDSRAWLYAAETGKFTDQNTIARFEIPINPTETGIFKMPLDNVGSAVLGIRVYGANGQQTLKVDRIWLE